MMPSNLTTNTPESCPQNCTTAGLPVATPLHLSPPGTLLHPPVAIGHQEFPSSIDSSYTFPSIGVSPNGNMAMTRNTAHDALETQASWPTLSSAAANVNAVSAEVQLARDRAMKIIQQFRDIDPHLLDSDVAQKRKASLEQLEQRKRLAMIKNLEYVARVEDERLNAKLLQVHQTQDYQNKLEAQHQQSLQIRLQHLGKGITNSTIISSQAGIGTQQQQRTEEKRRKYHQPASSGTVAIYISNLPTDGSASEELLRALFGSLGYTLRKIHLYVDKETGKQKGDALMVYELQSGEDRNSLMTNVCSQVRPLEDKQKGNPMAIRTLL